MKTVLQNNDQDCLLACYSMILSYFGKNISLNQLYNEDMIPPDGLSIKYLTDINIEHGIDMKVYKINKAESTVYEILKHIILPAIVHWDTNHFVVVRKVSRNKVLIIDPAIGKLTLSHSSFNNHFSGIIFNFKANEKFKKVTQHNIF